MSVSYKPVIWNRAKMIYDAVLLAGIVIYILVFLKLGPVLSPALRDTDLPTQRMRAFGSLALLLLTIILSIGPLARLDTRFMPLLYNRRHFGVMTAIVAATHAYYVLGWYFSYSPTPQLTALFTSNTSFTSIVGFPFELFGILALVILAVLAVTSHDFWLSFLTPPLWKAIHMSVYLAYAAVILHVALGALIDRRDLALGLLSVGGLALLCTLHLLAGRRESSADAAASPNAPDAPWIAVGDLAKIAEGRAIIGAAPGGERIAVFRSKGGLSAVSNVCSHQNGPIGEGKVVLGFITCPWHGYQYRLEDGCSPPPFRERIRKYRVQLQGSTVLVDPEPLPRGTKLTAFPIPVEFMPAAPKKEGTA
ncbi:nitrite reductase/ring-hydroxylating ferredoxin subunit/DMSO/TMAO reductase YedYZ heme-binding membrane subunit [Rhizobium laguerreae]|uniref:Nitrite reductase/ring-hydroxylating ferredoxin subunit/DMSO/TMAO reductase YedYZ heme-binding membrane subunit n=1 Tax=Rhizobium laguerreae TaxID=1076926 RepID=A0ABR6GKC9_9HYPH|nr:Rieske 2Fe-2S domain-containing protein [Rhizobium laguerreae]MBB3166306.1 nitrite reductase/ring-hydroxylating ferredoxin subunit/DMSO/TMAO reductase YedYZ heme-binding membrane subunit [Rhizobium laguerreae]NKM21028.1 Rieske 2Fe-2S domain-containing protein [Rhizobium laguerreae]OOO42837.1 (2Fe-2S)-binding protein [Rhizobium laguerreae]